MSDKIFLNKVGYVFVFVVTLEILIFAPYLYRGSLGKTFVGIIVVNIFFHIAIATGLLLGKQWGALLFRIFLYLLFLSFPVGTIISWKCLRKLRADGGHSINLKFQDRFYQIRRILAFFVDIVIVNFTAFFLCGVLAIRCNLLLTEQWIVGAGIFIIYFVACEWQYGGQTVGKKIFALVTVNTGNHNYPSLFSSLIRVMCLAILIYSRDLYLSIWPETKVGIMMHIGNVEYFQTNIFLFMGYWLSGLCQPKSQMLHDMVTKTCVIMKGVERGNPPQKSFRSALMWLFMGAGFLSTLGLYFLKERASDVQLRDYKMIYSFLKQDYPLIKHISADLGEENRLNIYLDVAINNYPTVDEYPKWAEKMKNYLVEKEKKFFFAKKPNLYLRTGYNTGMFSIVFENSGKPLGSTLDI